jgi:hypothetical protein
MAFYFKNVWTEKKNALILYHEKRTMLRKSLKKAFLAQLVEQLTCNQ